MEIDYKEARLIRRAISALEKAGTQDLERFADFRIRLTKFINES